MTGIVLDETTKQPIEGAYVLVGYWERVWGPVTVVDWCLKTRGMYTGKDGRYSFPVEREDSISPKSAVAIKPGYYRGDIRLPGRDAQGRPVYSGWDLTLRAQKDVAPEFVYGNGAETCNKVATREGAAAAVEFLRIMREEMIRYRADPRQIESVSSWIQQFSELPATGRPR